MPLRLEVKKKFSCVSDRVKCVDVHPTEPWVLASLFNGHVCLWNYTTQALIKDIEIGELPVRVAKFIARKQWVICGSDDMMLRVYNYNTSDKVKAWEAHQDYIRHIAVHPTHPYVISCSDDMTAKLWDWDKNWQNVVIFEGHSHYVMQVVFNPKDANMFATASLDRTLKVWGVSSPSPYFTLEGHEKGVNCLDYYLGADKPYIVSGADDRTIRVWDYQNKTCVAVLEGHTHNITCVCFHPSLPVLLSGSEDNTFRIWNANTYNLEKTLNYRMERVWALSCHKGSNKVSVGYDEGLAVVKLGSEEPPVSMDSSLKVIWAKHNEIKTVNLKGAAEKEEDGEKLAVVAKDLGACEVYPHTLKHDAKGRFVVVCGDGEYIIYTALKWRSKAYGAGQDVVWGPGAGEYAVQDGNRVKIFKNFKEKTTHRPEFTVEGIFGGPLLGVRSASSVSFYDWNNLVCVRKIDVTPRDIYWAESADFVVLACDDSFYVLKYHKEEVEQALSQGEGVGDEGVEGAFEVYQRFDEKLRTGCWAGDCFIYTNNSNRLSYCVGPEVVTIAHTEGAMYLIGYSPRHNRIFLMDKGHNIVSYKLHVSVINYQTAILRGDMEGARALLDKIPNEYRSRIAQFLENQGLKEEALEVVVDPDHKFEIAIQLKKLRVAYELAKNDDNPQKWHQLSEVAMSFSQFGLVEECFVKGRDLSGLLFLYSSTGNAAGLEKLAVLAKDEGKNNIAFLCYLLLQRLGDCVDLLIATNRIPEAAFFARTYAPSHVSRVVALWREDLKAINPKVAESLADPTEYMNLFPDFEWALRAEELLNAKRRPLHSNAYPAVYEFIFRDIATELKEGGSVVTPYDVDVMGGGSVGSAVSAVSGGEAKREPAPKVEEEDDDLDELDELDAPPAPTHPSPTPAPAPAPVHVPAPAPAAPKPTEPAPPAEIKTPPAKAKEADKPKKDEFDSDEDLDDLLDGEDLGDAAAADVDLEDDFLDEEDF